MAPMLDSERKEFKKLVKQMEKMRRELDWPQEKVADLCGVTQETYSRWVSGKSEPGSGLVLAGLKSRVPQLIAELKSSQKKIEKILTEIESLKGGD
ncbi:helix-turn-helix transcriptional regulator [Candidatus Acetothermia bacterium]|jgi:transcriptional regulator with XRE-family HTH domain|nr:helix-turn-helix transcriptional regulator [Candidatus Acetothermia bacterium]MCI2432213.1 helix-turn-helix transcriptional regulator [Candidatus Acetothermia bacterium]MCI2436116.1 helix-turn-helix transcriptional regulator [Candidatus Acetothermia bacterium]